MPRLPRNVLPERGYFHVTARGVDGTPIVRDRVDALAFLRLLARAVPRFWLEVHAFCLMTTHHHLVVDGPRDGVSGAVHLVDGAHALAFNRRHKRRGHLFGDRFWARPLESEDDLRDTCRYVIFNPVRAGLCEHPSEWPWLGSRYGLDGD